VACGGASSSGRDARRSRTALAVRASRSSASGGGAGSSGRDNGGSNSNNGGGRSGGERRLSSSRRAREPGFFEVKVVTPPPRSLGIHALPPLTHNGDAVEIDNASYVVTSLVLQYKLVAGRYVRDHSRLEVAPTSRFFLNLMLDGLVKKSGGSGSLPTGRQD
jgi:hypothetical protein